MNSEQSPHRWRYTGEVPAWLRETAGENRWPPMLAVVVTIALQLRLPDRLALRPHLVLPAVEAVLVVVLLVANPGRIQHGRPTLRRLSLLLVAVVSLGNATSAGLLVNELLHGRGSNDATTLFGSGLAVYGTNILAFALWYWEFDRGGPGARAAARRPNPDFLFAQMTAPEIARPDWEPMFPDYLYLSFTNATAFSPTDTLPLSRWAKMLMLVQSSIALITIGLVIARAVNVLK